MSMDRPSGRNERPEPLQPNKEQIAEAKMRALPPEVIETFNDEIVANMDKGGVSRVSQRAIVERLEAQGIDRRAIFDKGMLDVEIIYEGKGWKVHYEKPDYNETGDSFFTFEYPDIERGL